MPAKQQLPAQASAEAIDQLSSILTAYNETTDRLQESYRQLKGEVSRLRGELKRKNEQLERKNRLAALGEMAAGMAHEIRNPLGGIRLYASLIEGEHNGDESSFEWSRKIGLCVSNLDTIVTDMLAFTQDQVCEKADVNFSVLLAEILEYIQPRLKNDLVEVELDEVDEELSVKVDGNMIKRILLNLMLNALDVVGETGRIRVTANVCRDMPPFRSRISVSDTGGGVSSEYMNKIFNPFFTTKDTGTGLGLAIVHRLVECHGGIITVANNKTDLGGATFTVLLP